MLALVLGIIALVLAIGALIFAIVLVKQARKILAEVTCLLSERQKQTALRAKTPEQHGHS